MPPLLHCATCHRPLSADEIGFDGDAEPLRCTVCRGTAERPESDADATDPEHASSAVVEFADVDDGAEHAAAGFTLPPGMVREELLSKLLDHEREQRDMMWHAMREVSRLGQAVEQQHHVLAQLVDEVFHRADRQLPHGAAPGNDGRPTTAGVPPASAEPSTPAAAGDVERLQRALEEERDLVAKLQRAKLALERRAAAAEAKLEDEHDKRAGLLRRILGR